MAERTTTDGSTEMLYLELMKRVLTNVIYEDAPVPVVAGDSAPAEPPVYDEADRLRGMDIPSRAHTMIGMARLDNLQHCVTTVLDDGVPGDLVETGVWRGGASIFMRAVLKARGVTDRRVWVADTFAGMPSVRPTSHRLDRLLAFDRFNHFLAVPVDQVRENFARYDLLDEQVEFVPGLFRDSLPGLPAESIAVLRLDGDLYESTWDALSHLYPRVPPGGFVIVDDYMFRACREAVAHYRDHHGIDDEIVPIDDTGVYWRRAR